MFDNENPSLVERSLVAALTLLERDVDSALMVVHVLQDPSLTYSILRHLVQKAQEASEEFEDFTVFKTIEAIIAAWPLPTLRVSGAIPLPGNVSDKTLHHCCQTFFRALMDQKEHCKLQYLDIRGLEDYPKGYEYDSFEEVFTEQLPVMSLPKMDVARQAELVFSMTDLSGLTTNQKASFRKHVRRKVSAVRKKHFGKPSQKFYTGRPFTVIMGTKLLITQSQTDLFCFIHGLRHWARVQVQPGELNPFWSMNFMNSTISMSVEDGTTREDLPLLHPLYLHDLQYLKGLLLHNYVRGVKLYKLFPRMKSFQHLRKLYIPFVTLAYFKNVNESLTARLAPHAFLDDLCHLLTSLPRLHILNLDINHLAGGLGRILDSVASSLTYLSLKHCVLNQNDVNVLDQYKQAKPSLILRTDHVYMV